MRIEIIRPDGDLKREVWTYELAVSYFPAYIYFDHYSFQTRPTKRHNWRTENFWSRLDHRNNTIQDPPHSDDVEAEMRKRYQDYIMTLPIMK